MVNGVVHALDGPIAIARKHETGATVSIYLPILKEIVPSSQFAGDARSLHATHKQGGMRVMLVDDGISNTSLLTELQSMHGEKVSAFNKPERALSDSIHHLDDVDILITGATMSAVSGMELLGAILQLRPNIPILMRARYSDFVNAEST